MESIVSIGLLGKKIGMTQVFTEDGSVTPVTIVRVGPCAITQIKTEQLDGYNAIQLAYEQSRINKLSKAELGHLKKANVPPMRYLQEFKVSNPEAFTLGQVITLDEFNTGEFVDIRGQTIGKGFSGNQKRNNFKRGPMTHGSKNHRAPGSIGPGTTPGRVLPGKKMAGQLGNKQITISKLKILGVDSKKNLLVIKGSVPGKPGNLLTISPSKRIS